MSLVRPFKSFNLATVVSYFTAIRHNESPLSTLCDAASASSAAKNAEAITAEAVTDMKIFLFDTLKNSPHIMFKNNTSTKTINLPSPTLKNPTQTNPENEKQSKTGI